MRAWMLAATAGLLLTGCTGPEPLACTEIGAEPGVNVTVTADVAAAVEALTLTVCQDGTCRDHPVELSPGSRSIDQGCRDGVCSATAVPDGTLVGFVSVPDLVEGPVQVSGRYSGPTTPARLPPAALQALPSIPNGPQCPPRVAQVSVQLIPDGLR